MTLFDEYYQTFLEKGNRIAFEDEHRSWTYGDFLQLVSGIRTLLENSPCLDSKKPVAIMCHNKVETYASIFACWFSGHPYVPLNPSNPEHWNRGIVQKLNPGIFIDDKPETPDSIGKDLLYLCYSPITPSATTSPVRLEPNDLAYILTTSGTTGEPRNVPVSLQNLEAFFRGFIGLFPAMNENDRFLQTYDLTADAAFTAFMVPLYLGATVVLTPDHPFRYLSVANTLLKKQITWVQVTPSLLVCLRPYFPALRLNKIKYFHSGGEALKEDLVSQFRPSIPNAEIANVYGPTETTVTALIYQCPPGEKLKSYQGAVSIGKPIGDVEVLIISEDGSFVPGEGEGELLIGGSQVMRGYCSVQSAAAFYFPDNTGGARKYYRTGDKVMRDGNGFFYFLGRLNNQVKISGYRIDLTEVESVMSGLFGKQGFIAVAPEISQGTKKLIVFTTDSTLPEPEIKKRISDNYPEYLVPERIIPVDRIPLNLAGKADRKKLEQLYLATLSNE